MEKLSLPIEKKETSNSTLIFDKEELENFWKQTQEDTLVKFLEFCKSHEMMVGCEGQLKDISYLLSEYRKCCS